MINIKRNIIGMTLKVGILTTVMLTSCQKNFKEINTNPNAYTEPVIANLFTTSVIRTVGTGTPDRNRTNIKYFAGTMQYMASLGTNWSGDKNFENGQYGDFWDTVYGTHIKELQQVLAGSQGKPDLINLYAIASIWKIYALHRVTDAYGDCPYTQAELGFSDGIFKPVYDKQSDIYPAMLKGLETAIGQLDPAKSSYGAQDVIYQGNVAKWKTFAYSLMLRLGMRLTKAAPDMAKTYVQKAIAGGVFKSNADMAYLKHIGDNANTWNWDASELKRESFPESLKGTSPVKLSKTLIDKLQALNDPRLPFYATLWQGNIIATQAAALPTSTNPALQKGLPNGYDATSIKTVIPGWDNSQLVNYSEPNSGTVTSLSSPSVIMSYSEVEFLLAEAALRGWGDGATATHYNNAITASMQETTIFPGGIVIPGGAISTYLAANALNAGGTFDAQMNQIFTQFWLAHFMYFDNFEAWSTWRRTGYPVLTPPNYPGNFTGGKALIRLKYPVSETTLNTDNYNKAVANQGPDLYTTPVWWNK